MPSGNELPQQAVALLMEPPFSRTAGMTKIALDMEAYLDFPESQKRLAAVIGQRPAVCLHTAKQVFQVGRHTVHTASWTEAGHKKTACAFNRRQDVA